MFDLRQALARRPWWMNAMFVFCLYMTVVYMPFDMFLKPVADDEEVWFGVMLTGWAAKATEPLHWIIYGLGAYGFWKMRPWMWPWASIYVAQIAVGMLVWSLLYAPDRGLLIGGLAFVVFLVPTVALWRARHHFEGGGG